MSTSDGETFEQKGDDVATEVGRLGAQTSELDEANASAQREPEEAGNWITVIGRALLAIFGVGAAGGN